ncbi:MAG: acetylornithine deacetylase, partial [Pseudomonadota bacterium]
MTDITDARAIIDRLIAFDTTSRNSNLELIEWVESYLADYGVTGHRVSNAEGTKANLFATCGPAVEGGVILSGHTDVVPVDGQDWFSDPWVTLERDGKLYGRGTSDMKSFVALSLAFVPEFVKGSKPVHLAISYDEEVGCIGAPAMIAEMAKAIPTPRLALVGEPTSMKLVTGHKGITIHRVEVRGAEAHSSLVNHGVSANEHAIDLMHELNLLARKMKAEADPDNGYDPPYPTLTIGLMKGGEAGNILAGQAEFQFDLRAPPGTDIDAIIAPFIARCAALDAELKARFPQAGVTVERLTSVPAMDDRGSEDAVAFVRKLTGENAPTSNVVYAAEGGQFQQGGFPTVICGPGSIEQAHQPNEWIAIDQLEQGVRF